MQPSHRSPHMFPIYQNGSPLLFHLRKKNPNDFRNRDKWILCTQFMSKIYLTSKFDWISFGGILASSSTSCQNSPFKVFLVQYSCISTVAWALACYTQLENENAFDRMKHVQLTQKYIYISMRRAFVALTNEFKNFCCTLMLLDNHSNNVH